MPAQSHWRLRHAWCSQADLAALALCRERLASLGICFGNAEGDAVPDAVKMHGMEIADALAAGPAPLLDLRAAAVAAAWATRLPSFVRRYMVHGERWHGIPMGIHRANLAWVNAKVARQLGAQVPAGIDTFLQWLQQAQRSTQAAPLAVGAEPWQIGVLFESVALAVAGPQVVAQAFEALQPEAWRSPAMLQALHKLLALRAFVSDAHLNLGWAEQLARVRHGSATVQLMGDWARRASGDELLEWAAPGTAGGFVAIVDFFAPLASAPVVETERAAVAFTSAAFQLDFARSKGCMPAVREAWGDCDPLRMRLLKREAAVVPSFTFDQCCPVATQQALLAVLADHFIHRRDAKACAQALADVL